jgi:hypothetical protein
MFRLILYLLLAVIIISVLRTVIGVLAKAFSSLLQSGPSPASSRPRQTGQLGGNLHRDPICGTFVAESTPFQRRLPGQVFYYCSDACREKHALVAK